MACFLDQAYRLIVIITHFKPTFPFKSRPICLYVKTDFNTAHGDILIVLECNSAFGTHKTHTQAPQWILFRKSGVGIKDWV